MLVAARPILPPTIADIGSSASRIFGFDRFVLIPQQQVLLECGVAVRIGGRALDLLTALVERAGELVDKQVLMTCAWPTTFVDEANLKVNMASIRRALGEHHATPRYIATVVGRGYRFIAPVRTWGPQTGGWTQDSAAIAVRVAGLVDAVEAIQHELRQISEASTRSPSARTSAGSPRPRY